MSVRTSPSTSGCTSVLLVEDVAVVNTPDQALFVRGCPVGTTENVKLGMATISRHAAVWALLALIDTYVVRGRDGLTSQRHLLILVVRQRHRRLCVHTIIREFCLRSST